MEFRILGPLEVRDGGGNVVAIPRRQQRVLLATLLVHVGEVVSVDRLVDDLWGENPPAAAVGGLQNTVWQLRKLLGADLLRRQAPGYVLDVDPETIDARRFERLVASAEGLEPGARANALREALALWRGPALADFAGEQWAAVEASRLDERRLEALEERIQAELELGRHFALVAQLEALTVEHPLRERLYRQLALALYRSGRQADALEAIGRARKALDAIGLEPSPELRQLERDILNQSPSIAAPGTTLEEEPVEEAGERRIVSVLAADLPDEEDPEALSATLKRVLAAATDAVARHGGELERFGPEGLVAIFGADGSREDDAMRAVRAAVELHETAEVAVGVATGEAMVGGEPRVAGSAVARAAGLARTGKGVLIGPRTLALVRDAVTVEEKAGLARVLTVHPTRPVPRDDTPLVGREEELACVRAALAAGSQATFTVVGEPGIGKSRLAREVVRSFDGAVLIGRCAAYGEGATFLPLVDALRGVDVEAAVEGSDDAELVTTRIAALEGAAQAPGTLGESYWAVRRLLESLAAVRPLLLVLDDVHWAEPALLDLVDYVEARVGDTPVRILCMARPELLESRPAWATRSLTLAPLDEEDTRELVGVTAELDDEARERIVELAEGNPLYAQQLATFAAESGKALEPGAMPATIDAVLAGRLGRLDAGERATLQRAAVVGRIFSRGAVAALAPPDLAVDAHLLALARRGFVKALPDPLPGDDAYRFHHGLLRDAAYATLTKEQRADLHEEVAAWLDRDGPGDDAIVGYHLEQAAVTRTELGRAADALAAAAGERLASAGGRAWRRNDGRAALGLVERALRLLPPGATRAATDYEFGLILYTQGHGSEAVETLRRASAEAAESNTPTVEIRARLELARLGHARDELSSDELLALATDSIAALTAMGDGRGLARAWLAASAAHSYACRMEAMGSAAAHAFRCARLAGFSGQAALSAQATALVYGPAPADRAIAEAASLLDQASDGAAEADVEAALAALHAMTGAAEEARRLADHARALYDDIGAFPVALHASLTPLLMEVERFAGDVDAAVSIGNESVEALLSLGANAHAATRALQVADAELGRDNLPEAKRLLRIAKANAVVNDVLTAFLGSAIEARVVARTSKAARADRLVHEASRLAATTDAWLDRVRVAVAAEEVARRCSDANAARAAANEAKRLRKAKGARAYGS